MIQSIARPQPRTDFSLAEAIFGSDFDVWAFDQRWHRIRSQQRLRKQQAADGVRFYVQLIDWLNESAAGHELQMRAIDHQVLCLLPLSAGTRKLVATHVVSNEPAELCRLAQRAATAAVAQQKRTSDIRERLLRSDSQLAAWASRIAQSNAELQWFHQLSLNAEVTLASETPLEVARRILPEMCRLARARTVAFVCEPTADDCRNATADIWQTGDIRLPERVCLALIAECAEITGGPPVTRNYETPAFACSRFPGVLTSIVKAVTRNNRRVGWLLAVNKDLQYLVESDPFDRLESTIQRECQFGHFECGLVEAAANTIATHAHNCSLIRQKERLFEGAIRSLVNAIDAKDSYTCGHSDRVADFAREISRALTLDQLFCEQVYMTGLLHDVGKIGVPDEVLQKPGRLTDDEFDKIKQHPLIGHDILRHLGEFDYVLPGVLHHHEAFDGSGYPDGLCGDSIPLMARILAVADAYDAMTSDRPYRKGMSSTRAEEILCDGAGRQWDAECVAAFRDCLPRLKQRQCSDGDDS